jgi:hypothetical protein
MRETFKWVRNDGMYTKVSVQARVADLLFGVSVICVPCVLCLFAVKYYTISNCMYGETSYY